MATDYSIRTCGGTTAFNSGISRCPVPRGKIKGLIFVPHGVLLPTDLTVESLEKFFHADRPNRGFPVKLVDEFAPSGGEAEVTQQGYGANKITGYSARTNTFTLNRYDAGLRANVVEAKNVQFDVYQINEENIIFGERGNKGEFKGIPLSGVYVGGQEHDSSGQVANLTLNLIYTDIERYFRLEEVRQVDFEIIDTLEGLVEVDFQTVTTGKYKLREVYGGLDVTEYYGELLAAKATTALPGATGVTYSGGVISATGTIKLAKPSILQTNGITGIEQI